MVDIGYSDFKPFDADFDFIMMMMMIIAVIMMVIMMIR